MAKVSLGKMIDLEDGSFLKVDRALASLPKRVSLRVARKVVNKASTPVLRRARQLAPKKSRSRKKYKPPTGLLRKSLGRKLTRTRRGEFLAIIGPRRRFSGERHGKPALPTKYAHLVEFGTKRSRAQPFLRPAFDETRSEAESIFRRELWAGIQQEVAKLKQGAA